MPSKGFFNQIGAFENQFTPVEGGYLYYPSAKSGGKLVTNSEFDSLKKGWQRVASTTASMKAAGIVLGGLIAWGLMSAWLALPGWTDWIVISGAGSFVTARIFRASFAPRRLVRDRPEIVPPRSRSDAKRVARSALRWRMVVFVLAICGLIFAGCLAVPDYTPSWWAWAIGSGAMFGAYLWIAYLKFQDGRSNANS